MDSLQKQVVDNKNRKGSDEVIGDGKKGTAASSRTRNNSTASHSNVFPDSSGASKTARMEILAFIESTLHKNSKDRDFLIETEKQLKTFLENESASYFVFPSLSSYNRMLLHRVSDFFGLLHNVDQSGQKIVVTKYSGTRMPDISFESLIRHSNFTDGYAAKRGALSFDESQGRRYPTLREFRARFNTTSTDDGHGENPIRVRRAQSFDVEHCHGFQKSFHPLPNATNRQSSSSMDHDRAGSNCSSTESSTVLPVHVQFQSMHLPIVQTDEHNAQSTEVSSMISPSSVYSETGVQTQSFKSKPCEACIDDSSTKKDPPAIRPPSLFSIQPGTQIYPSEQAYYPFYEYPFIPSSCVFPNLEPPNNLASIPSYYAAGQIYYPACSPFYYPTPSYQQPLMHPTPLLNENVQQLLNQQVEQLNLTDCEEKEVEKQDEERTNKIQQLAATINAENTIEVSQKD